MKIKYLLIAVALFIGATANAQGLSDILKGLGNSGTDASSMVGNLVEGVFTKTNIGLDDIVGSYVSEGPAVAFKSDNFLKKAGGLAEAAALETKLKPYYEQYGLTGLKLEVDSAANFTMNVKGMNLTGTVVHNEDEGTFTFNFMAMGMKIGQFTAYIQKSGKDLALMFDANKLKQIVSTISKFSGSSLATAFSKILDSYEGCCIGFDLKAQNSGGSSNSSSGTQSAGPGLDYLRNLLNRKK